MVSSNIQFSPEIDYSNSELYSLSQLQCTLEKLDLPYLMLMCRRWIFYLSQFCTTFDNFFIDNNKNRCKLPPSVILIEKKVASFRNARWCLCCYSEQFVYLLLTTSFSIFGYDSFLIFRLSLAMTGSSFLILNIFFLSLKYSFLQLTAYLMLQLFRFHF